MKLFLIFILVIFYNAFMLSCNSGTVSYISANDDVHQQGDNDSIVDGTTDGNTDSNTDSDTDTNTDGNTDGNSDKCPSGTTEIKGECIDIDECQQELHDCSTDTICLNTYGSYQCVLFHVTILPREQTVNEGITATFIASVTTTTTESINYYWYINDYIVSESTTNQLEVTYEPDSQTDFSITCLATSDSYSDEDNALLTVRGPDVVNDQIFYVSTKGSDSYNGKYSTHKDGANGPWGTVPYAISQLSPGDTLNIREGTYSQGGGTGSTVASKAFTQLTQNINSTDEADRITIQAYRDEKPIISGINLFSNWQRCNDNDAELIVDGTINPNYQNIFWTYFTIDDIGTTHLSNDLLTNVYAFEDNQFLIPCNDSVQESVIINQLQMHTVSDESEGLTNTLVDSGRLNQADHYWQDAKVKVWLHSDNTNISTRFIADSQQATTSISFGSYYEDPSTLPEAITITGNAPDAYTIFNHPHLLNAPGQYYYTPRADAQGRYKLYVWPNNEQNITQEKIGVSKHTIGFYLTGTGTGNTRNFFTFNGLELVGFCSLQDYPPTGGITSSTSGDGYGNIEINNCNIHDVASTAIALKDAVGAQITDNTFQRVLLYHAVYLRGSENTVIQNNTMTHCERTILSAPNSRNLMIIGNTLSYTGLHGQGLSIYDYTGDPSPTNVLLAHNIMNTGNYYAVTLNTMGFFVAFGNVFITTYPNAYWTITDWGTGFDDHYILNNTILQVNTYEESLYLETTANGYCYNNILDGGYIQADGTYDSSYNLYLKGVPSSLATGEIDGSPYIYSDVFVAPDIFDYQLRIDSPASGQGIDLQNFLNSQGITSIFPDFDFTVDMNGTSWSATPSMGAYEITP